MRWNKVTIIGMGLLGGSLGMALRKQRLCSEVVGYVRRPSSVRECQRHGAVDHATTNLPEAVQDADLVVLCTPLAQMTPLAQRMVPVLKPGAIVTDVGSVKAPIVREIERALQSSEAQFVGSHPIAGSEKTGVAAAKADLFRGALCVVTPTKRTARQALRKVESFWKQLDCRLMVMTPEEHDLLVSRSSHLPYLLAVQLTNLVLDPKHVRQQQILCASGFRDTTRVASGSPEMWRDIAFSNRKHLVKVLGTYLQQLTKLKRLIEKDNAEGYMQYFADAKQRRDSWLEWTGSSSVS